jgi:hypothetical protein
MNSATLPTRRAFLRSAAPIAAAAAPLAAPPGDRATVRCIEAYHASKIALTDAHARSEDDDELEPYRDRFFSAEEALIGSILGWPTPDCMRRYWPTRGFVHAGLLYLAIAEDPDSEEMLRPGEGREGGGGVMQLRILAADAIEGLAGGALPRRPSPLPRPEHPELRRVATEFRHAAEALRRLQPAYDLITATRVRAAVERYEETTWDPAEARLEDAEAELVRLMRRDDIGAVNVGGLLVADQAADVVATESFLPSWTTTVKTGTVLFLD